MKKYQFSGMVLLVFIVLSGYFYLWSASTIPFHPDESTNIWMSDDFKSVFSQPAKLIFQPGNGIDTRMHYRMVDAPLTRYLLGLGRLIFGNLPPLPADWNWSQTWQQNEQNGALPFPGLLVSSRLIITLLLPLSILFLFLITRSVGNTPAAWIAILLFASNALVLLHTRRAMAEGVLIFTEILCLWSIVRKPTNPFLIGLTAAFAFNAKYSLAPLAILGALAVMWCSEEIKFSLKKVWKPLLFYVLTFVVVTYLLNPYLWTHPYQAAVSAFKERQTLVASQVETFAKINSGQAPSSITERAINLVAQLYFTPPNIAETSNYIMDTRNAEVSYFSYAANNLMRGWIPGGIILILSIFGFCISLMKIIHKPTSTQNRGLALLCAGSIFQFLAILVLVPLSFQRYTVPLIPYICIWCALAVSGAVDQILIVWKGRSKVQEANN